MSRKIILSTNHANTNARWWRPTSIVSSTQELSDAVKDLPGYVIQISGIKYLEHVLLDLANALGFNVFAGQDIYIEDSCRFKVAVYQYSRCGKGYDGVTLEVSELEAYPIIMQKILKQYSINLESHDIRPAPDQLLERMLFTNLEMSLYAQE